MSKLLYIADDHPLIVDSLSGIFKDDFSQIDSFGNGRELIINLRENSPDLLFLDINLPLFSGVEVLQESMEMNKDCRVNVFTMYNSKSLVNKCIELGVDGYLLKTSSESEIRKAAESNSFYLGEGVNFQSKKTEKKIALTAREREVLKLLALDKSTKTIANELCISELTVTAHRRNLKKKMGVDTIAGAVTFGYENGLIFI